MESRAIRILADNLSRLRELHQYTLEQVSEHIGIAPSGISSYENAKIFPSGHSLDRFVDLYCIAHADLFRPEGAADKAFSLAATEDHAIEIVNRKMLSGDYELKKRKK